MAFLWLCCWPSAFADSEAEESPDSESSGQVVRLLSPPGRIAEGNAEVEALLIDPEIRELVFLVDGEEMDRRRKLPWRGTVRLKRPAEPQTLTVRAYGPNDRWMGEDSVEINRVYRPLRVRLQGLSGAVGEYVLVSGEVSLPYGAELERTDVYINEHPLATLRESKFSGRLTHPIQHGDIVRVLTRLRDGRTVEDAGVFGVEFVESAETYLVQVQVLVNHRNGPPIRGLTKEDFKVEVSGVERRVNTLAPAGDVALNVGLVVDSSGSMESQWRAVQGAVQQFLGVVIASRDQVFLTTFSDGVKLAHGLTPDPSDIDRAMSEVRPDGLTALYDSVAFSMLQFADRPGRRALVVITDGADYGSHTDPKQGVELGRRLGIPVYIVAMRQRQGASGARLVAQETPVHTLKLLTDPTGGRLLRTSARGGLGRAFQQIADELRSQYLLSFYTDRPIDDLNASEIEITVPGKKKVEVRAVMAWDQIR